MSKRPCLLVTGAAGFFGLAIVRALVAAGHDVVAVDRAAAADHHPRYEPGATVRYECRDLERESIGDLLGHVDTVVHAAALTPGAETGEKLDELLSVNLAPLPALLRALRTSTRTRGLVFVSSAAVYEASRDAVLTERDASGGASLYAAAKLAAELTLARYATLANLQFAIVRPTSLFGPGEAPRLSRPRISAFAALVEAARAGSAVRIENGLARTDWLHVDDAAEAVAALVGAPRLPDASFSLSSGTPCALIGLAQSLVQAVGLTLDDDAELVVSAAGDRPARIVNDRLVAATGWRPRRTFEDAARELLAEEAPSIAVTGPA